MQIKPDQDCWAVIYCSMEAFLLILKCKSQKWGLSWRKLNVLLDTTTNNQNGKLICLFPLLQRFLEQLFVGEGYCGYWVYLFASNKLFASLVFSHLHICIYRKQIIIMTPAKVVKQSLLPWNSGSSSSLGGHHGLLRVLSSLNKLQFPWFSGQNHGCLKSYDTTLIVWCGRGLSHSPTSPILLS